MAVKSTATTELPEDIVDRTGWQRLNDLRAELGGISKNKKNDHFKSKYADINAILDQINDLMVTHDLTFMQTTELVDVGEHSMYRFGFVTTTKLLDARSGQVLEQMAYPIVSKDYTDPQKVGSGQTYARRYSLLTLLGLGTDDDDGNAAAAPSKAAPTEKSLTQLRKEVTAKYGIKGPEDLLAATTKTLGPDGATKTFNDLDTKKLTDMLNASDAPAF